MQLWTNFVVQNGSNGLKRLKKRVHCSQTMLKKSWLCIILHTYAQILCLFFHNPNFIGISRRAISYPSDLTLAFKLPQLDCIIALWRYLFFNPRLVSIIHWHLLKDHLSTPPLLSSSIYVLLRSRNLWTDPQGWPPLAPRIVETGG